MKNVSLLLFLFISLLAGAQNELTVERIWKSGEFYAQGVDGFTPLSDGTSFTRLANGTKGMALRKYSFKDFRGEGKVVLELNDILYNNATLEIDNLDLSEDGKKAIVYTQTEPIYRHSYKTNYYVYDLATKRTVKLHNTDELQTLATLSPDGNKVAYVAANNLYVHDLSSGKITQLTTDGKPNSVINGTTDWVYEEEFAITQGFEWSPDSRYIAFLRFDESKVREFDMAIYDGLYPSEYRFKYPKAGEDNSVVTMNFVDISTGKITAPTLGAYEYLPRFQWSPVSNELIVLTMNRHQSELSYSLITNPASPQAKVFYTETSDTYIDIDDNLRVLSDGKSLIRSSEKDGFNHLYQLGFNGTMRQITSGSWDVIELYGMNEKRKMLYYASAENGAMNKTLYAISLDGKKKMPLSPKEGYHSAEFSSDFSYFVRSSSAANTVPTYTLCDNTGRELQLLESNSALQTKLDAMKLSKKEFLQFPGVEGMLNGWIMKPADFDPNKKYPVYINIYCGPGSNTVQNEYEGANYLYHQLLTQKGYIVVSVDPRGTMYRGAKFKKSTYMQLGKLETEDIIAVGRHLQTLGYVDPARIGIQGWSYGGFMTSLAMTKGADVFKTGIAVAPVTNWRYYDNIYTERYMRTPQENASGYDDNSPVNHAAKLKGKFLLIHGSADDNVHYQNTMEFINALVKANRQFDLFIYPNKNHGIYGGNTRNHLFTMMLDYTLENL
jgi:dipeptidyl-peptidase 4